MLEKTNYILGAATIAALMLAGAGLSACAGQPASSSNSNMSMPTFSSGDSANSGEDAKNGNVTSADRVTIAGRQTIDGAPADAGSLTEGVEGSEEVLEEPAEAVVDEPAIEEETIPSDGAARDFAGWYRAAIPQGYDIYSDEAFFSENGADIAHVVVFNIYGFGTEMERNLDEVIAAQIDAEKENYPDIQPQIVDAQLGHFMWRVVACDYGDEWYSLNYYTDLGNGTYVQITADGFPLGDAVANNIVSSFELLPGNAYDNWQAWASRLYFDDEAAVEEGES